jgi:hypothetical protein
MSKKEKALQQGLQSMSSKSGGFAGLITGAAAPTQEQAPQPKVAKQAGTASAPTYGRLCAVVNVELQRKMQVIAHRHSLTFKEVLEAAMSKAVAAYEEKNGEILLSDGAKDSKELF